MRPRRIAVFAALGLGAGILLGVRVMFSAWWLLAAASGALLIWVLHCRKSPVLPGVVACAFFTGVALCSWQMHPLLPPEGEYQVTAQVDGEARVREQDGRIAVYLKQVQLTDEAGVVYTLDGAYWTYWPEEQDTRVPLDGQTAAFTARVYPPDGQKNPYGFDFRMYLLQRGATVGITGCSGLCLSPEGQTQPASWVIRARRAILARLNELLGEDDALAGALLLSVRDGMPEDMRADFQRAGLAHVLSVSGLHVMILMSAVAALLRRFSLAQSVVLLITLALLVPYCLLVGSTAAILRATLLMLYMLLGRVLRRRPDRLTALAAAFVVILLARPLEMFSAGFQMSFAAVAGLVMLGDRVGCLTRKIRPGFLRHVLRVYGATLCANLAVALPVMYHYHQLSLAGLLVNPLLCPAITLMLPLLALLLGVSVVSMPLARALGQLLAIWSRAVTQAVHWTAAWKYASLSVPCLPWYVAAAIILCMILCTRFVLIKKRVRWAVGASALLASCLVMLAAANRDVRYIQLSLGNADAAVIEDGRSTIVIDTGSYGGDVAEYLLSTGRRADVLILTHLHTDHALGLNELISSGVEIGEICLSTEAMKTPVSGQCLQALEAAQARGIAVRQICAGDVIETQRVRMEVLWPERDGAVSVGDCNDFALALAIDLDGIRLLHMSDVSGAYEMYAAQPADVLKIAHHGSSDSTRARFLAAVTPQLALLSSRLPSGKTLERLAQSNVMVYDTDTRGALILTARAGEMRIRGYLQ